MEFSAIFGNLALEQRKEWYQNKIKEGQKSFALSRLESKLAKILTVANGHRKHKLPKHDRAYYVLLQQAEDLIDQFCSDYSVGSDTIYAQIPAMKELQEWGVPAPAEMSKPVKFAIVGIAVMAGTFIVGFLSGSIQLLFHYGWLLSHLAHHAH